jgi:hypothetical protein
VDDASDNDVAGGTGSGGRWLWFEVAFGERRAEELDAFIGTRVGGPGSPAERPVSIGEYK